MGTGRMGAERRPENNYDLTDCDVSIKIIFSNNQTHTQKSAWVFFGLYEVGQVISTDPLLPQQGFRGSIPCIILSTDSLSPSRKNYRNGPIRILMGWRGPVRTFALMTKGQNLEPF